MALRREIKYVVPVWTAHSIEQKLDRVLARDSHGMDGVYTVRSLYFDTVDNMDFWDKIAGTEQRKKIRLRIYDTDGSLCKLESKQKYGDLQKKDSFIIDRSDAYRLSCGEIGVLRDYFADSTASVDLYAAMSRDCYRPSVQIEYDRIAYQYSLYDTRITLDWNVRASEADRNIFSPDIMFMPLMPEQVILEVKYNEKIMGFITDILESFDLTQESYSKYCFGRRVYYDFIR